MKLGQIGERAARRFLVRKGLTFIERNWSCGLGEIDLLFLDERELVAVEVKSRLVSAHAERHVFDNVDARKKRKLRQLVEIYCRQQFLLRMVDKPLTPRIDVVGVLFAHDRKKVISIRHLVAAC